MGEEDREDGGKYSSPEVPESSSQMTRKIADHWPNPSPSRHLSSLASEGMFTSHLSSEGSSEAFHTLAGATHLKINLAAPAKLGSKGYLWEHYITSLPSLWHPVALS